MKIFFTITMLILVWFIWGQSQNAWLRAVVLIALGISIHQLAGITK